MRCMSYSMQPYLRVDVCQLPLGAVCGICCPHLRLSAIRGIGFTWVSPPLDHGLARTFRLLFCTESRRGEPSGPLSSDDAPAPTGRRAYSQNTAALGPASTVIFELNRRSGAQYEPDTHHWGSATHHGE